MTNTAIGELLRGISEDDGNDPTRRAELSKLRINNNTNDIIKSFNIDLRDLKQEYPSKVTSTD